MNTFFGKKLVVLRRSSGGFGGAEKIAGQFREIFSETWDCRCYSAGNGIDAGLRGPGWFKALRFAHAADQKTKAENPDVVFSMERGPRCDIYRAGDGVHRRWVEIAYSHSLSRFFNPLHFVFPKLERRTLLSARRIVANSHMVAGELARFYPEFSGKIKFIRNGVNFEKFFPVKESLPAMRARLGLPEAPAALFVGSGWERKGLAPALRIFAETSQRLGGVWKNANFIVLGKGKPKKYETLVSSLGLGERVKFLGGVSNPGDFYRASDFLILPVLYDPCSNACLEALACGCPVVTTKNNGAAELVKPFFSGIILNNPEDAHAEAAGIAEFLASDKKGSRKAIADSVHKLALAREREEYRALFTEVLEEKRNHAHE